MEVGGHRTCFYAERKNLIEDGILMKEKGVAVGANHVSGREEKGSRIQGQRLDINSKTDIHCTVTKEKMGWISIQTPHT